ncbi:MAG: hypothetical protein NUV53_01825 [Patescibacteria group bacterium]|nr:hypothetical protein [Patescibacteria group bacterium]
MSTAVLVKKLNKEVSGLREEVRRMRAVFLHTVIDREGKYRQIFIKKTLAREQEKPQFRFDGREAFFRHVRGK